ncbi:DUF924 family protein [Panacagrimonas sp.]|uniref:DUF924 family protein n=1 Tax=Panacagrimonas sp. TaxID=2480088 RepID=UPI003B517962
MGADDVSAVLGFWFGDEPDDTRMAASRNELWWSGSPAVDARVRQFAPLRAEVIAQADSMPVDAAPAQLVRILLVDQFSRNLFRGQPAAFEHDAIARRWLAKGCRSGLDLQLRPIQRVFFYLPLEHSEDLTDQDRCVSLFQNLLDAAPAPHRDLYAGYLDYAEAHRKVIRRFGRFPHRNAILGRPSTPEEIEFLRQPGSSF